MFKSSPLPKILVTEFKKTTSSTFARSLLTKARFDGDDELLRVTAEYFYGRYQLGSASLLYRKNGKTLEVTGFYPFDNAKELRGRNLGVVFYQKLLEKINPYLAKDVISIKVIPNRINTAEYIGFLERLGFDGRAEFPYQTLLERSLLAARKRSSLASYVIN